MSDRGSITLWTLGLVVMTLFLGGVSLDLWRAFEARAQLAGMADSAAAAGASRIEATVFRDTGEVRLDPQAAEDAADAHLDGLQHAARISDRDISAEGATLTVALGGEVEFSLLRVLLGSGRVEIRATGSAAAFVSP